MVSNIDIEVKEIKGLGYCDGCGEKKAMKVGQKWTFPDDMNGFCHFALNNILQYVYLLRYDGTLPMFYGTGVKDTVERCCPDARRPVVFSITRIEQ